jgi:hypothetical protein
MNRSLSSSAEKFFQDFDLTTRLFFDNEDSFAPPSRPVIANLNQNFESAFEFKESYPRETIPDSLVLLESQDSSRSTHKNMYQESQEPYILKKIASPPTLDKNNENAHGPRFLDKMADYFLKKDASTAKNKTFTSPSHIIRFPFDDLTNTEDHNLPKTNRFKINNYPDANCTNPKDKLGGNSLNSTNRNFNNLIHQNPNQCYQKSEYDICNDMPMRNRFLNSFRNEKFVSPE